jgi:alpha-tubulin suppressor-like RCC1 family protein
LNGQLGDGTTIDKHSPVQVTGFGTDVAEVAVGLDYTCARKTDGTLWCWGYNSYGQLGDGTTVEKNTAPVASGKCQ